MGRDILTRTAPIADHRIPYGSGPSQFGDLWLPQSARLSGTIVFLHGGWWQSEYDLAYAGFLCDRLRRDGFTVWSLEYRRVGATGGGWPTTFQDAAAGFDHLQALASVYPIDLKHVIAMGHSAGGHLAFWLAGRHHIDPTHILYQPQPKLFLQGVIALAGAVDLGLTIELAGDGEFAHDKGEVESLMGGLPTEYPARYRAGDPGELLPLGVHQVLIQGTSDQQIPPSLPDAWAKKARRLGDSVTVTIIPGADHFDIVDPDHGEFEVVRTAVRQILVG